MLTAGVAGSPGTPPVCFIASLADTPHPKDQKDSLFNLLEECLWNSPGLLNEARAFQHGELRHIGYGTGRKSGLTHGAGYVPWRLREVEVSSHGNNDDGGDAALVEKIGLDDEDGPSVAGLRTCWATEVSPPDLSASQLPLLLPQDRQ